MGSITRPSTLSSSVNHTAVIPAAMTTQRLTKASRMATTVTFDAVFTIPSILSSKCWLCADDVAHGSFKLHAEELELTRRCAEPLRVAHHPAAVEQQQETVLAVQQGIDLFVDTPCITTERLSKCHGYSSALVMCDRSDESTDDRESRRSEAVRAVLEGRGDSARDRKKVSSPARGPNIAETSAHNVRAST
mgnify:CR=1 FL=1